MQCLPILNTFVSCAEVSNPFGSKVGIFFDRNTKIHKICKLRMAIFCICGSRTNFAMLFLAECIS